MRANPNKRLQECAARGRQLMRELGEQELGKPLQDLGWNFGFDNAKRRLGQCVWMKSDQVVKRISLSRHYAALNGLELRDEYGLAVLDDVIRHEIAHAVDYEKRGISDHSGHWKQICARVGADPSRTYEGRETARAPGRYVAACPRCGFETEFYRRPSNVRYCGGCCRKYNGGELSDEFKLKVIDRRTDKHVPFLDDAGSNGRGGPSDGESLSPAERGYKYTARCPHCGRETGFRRMLRRNRACAPCCDEHAGGRYDERFELRLYRNY